tara:strand:- start:7444 stop:7578 length:135 start_codon:yes stop_codon:yes gene_type:complete
MFPDRTNVETAKPVALPVKYLKYADPVVLVAADDVTYCTEYAGP